MFHERPRLPRVERARPAHLEDETSHLWAISYADFLMVLLSFFIIFFSLDQKQKRSVIDEIIAFSSKTMGGSPTTPPSESSKGMASLPKEVFRGLSSETPDWQVETKEDGRAVLILLPDNIYAKGSTQLSGPPLEQFKKLIQFLKPFQSKVRITFIGHTDAEPVTRHLYPGVNDNFDLSAARALAALKSAVTQGVDKESVFLSGAAESGRNSRTLSVLIEDRGV